MPLSKRFFQLVAALTVFIFGDVAADDNVDAERIYQESCSVCHGDDGSGAIWGQASLSTPPRNFRSAAARRELTRDRMIASVIYGRPNTPMPGFASQLTVPEITAVVDFVRESFMSPANAASVDGTDQVVAGGGAAVDSAAAFVGDMDRGRHMYNDNCVPCHGERGDGNGPRAYFIFPKPRNFLDPTTRQFLNRANLYLGIENGVIGKEMPAWGKVLSHQEIADIAEYVYREFLAAANSDAGAQ